MAGEQMRSDIHFRFTPAIGLDVGQVPGMPLIRGQTGHPMLAAPCRVEMTARGFGTSALALFVDMHGILAVRHQARYFPMDADPLFPFIGEPKGPALGIRQVSGDLRLGDGILGARAAGVASRG